MKETFVVYHGQTVEEWHVQDEAFDEGRSARWDETIYCLYSRQVPDVVRSYLQKKLLDVLGKANVGIVTDPKELTKVPLYVKVSRK